MYPVRWVEATLVLLLIWLTVLSYFFWRQKKILDQLFPKKSSEASDAAVLIREKFDQIIRTIEEFGRREKIFSKHLQELRKESLGFIQKVEVIRFNPYNDTGGDQSFSIVLLDGKNNGVIITSLHSRTGTRIYTKTLTAGKANLELSKEEKELLNKVISS